MTNPKKVLSPEDYLNYRNVRAVSVLFVVFGSVLVLGGIALAFSEKKSSQEEVHPAIAIGLAIAGLAGAIGGIAALAGSRRLAPLVYVMATLYIFGFPVGTILSIVMFMVLSRYLDSMDRIKPPRDVNAKRGTSSDRTRN